MRSIQSEEEEGSRRELRAKEAPEIKGVETRGAGAAAMPPKPPSCPSLVGRLGCHAPRCAPFVLRDLQGALRV